MHDRSPGFVLKNVRIRNLDDATYEKLRTRAAAEGMLLSQYLRRELDHMASLATMADLLLPRVWELRGAITAYDASYVALAERFDVPLLTCDAKLGGSNGHRAEIVVYRRS